MIREAWQAEVVTRDLLDDTCLICRIADLLYPGVTMAADRQAQLRKDHPDFCAVLEPPLRTRIKTNRKLIDDWHSSQSKPVVDRRDD